MQPTKANCSGRLYDDLRLTAGLPLPEALLPLRARAAARLAPRRAGLRDGGRHLAGGAARMRLRPWPAVNPRKADVLSLALPPRSAYVLSADARWRWQHGIAPTTEHRWSITFRTPRVR